MDEKTKEAMLQARKKKQQFLHRRDVGEEVNIKSLPLTLIEAVKNVLKKNTNQNPKITLKHGSNPLEKSHRHSFIKTNPKYDEGP